jgi:hypothetical protein
MAVRDLIGKRGEAIFVARLMDFCGNPEPYFDPHWLGDKCPTYDYLVELVNARDSTPYFFVQVKATQKAQTKRERRLVVQVGATEVQRMVECPVPTYLVGVDEPSSDAYIVFDPWHGDGPDRIDTVKISSERQEPEKALDRGAGLLAGLGSLDKGFRVYFLGSHQ